MNKGFQQYKRLVYFLIIFLVSAGITWMIREPGFSQAQIYVLFLLFFSVGLWLTETVPPYAVGLMIIAYLAYTLGYKKFTDNPQDIRMYVNTFSSSVIWLMLGGFVLASALTKTKLDLDLIKITLRVCGNQPKRILLGIMLVSMAASLLISNTATTAMVVAAVMPLLAGMDKNSPVKKALILGVPIAATTGGMGTMIGTPPNAIATGAIISSGNPFNFISWIYYGLPISILLTLISWWVLSRFLLKGQGPLTVESSPAESVMESGLRTKRIMVIVISSITLLLWLTTPLHGLTAAAVAAVPLVFMTLTQILKGEDIRALGWDTLILVAGGLSLGTGLQQAGLLDLYGARIAALHVPDPVFFFLMAYATMLFSNVMSNTATCTVLIPLGMAILPDRQLAIAMIIGLSASTALFLPVSTPPNAIVYSTGLIEQKDFRIGGILIGLLGPALIVGWVLLVTML
jgi:solute carrier family 13 (sodium-dependent dicarboxylate transporter), member 2/3/5